MLITGWLINLTISIRVFRGPYVFVSLVRSDSYDGMLFYPNDHMWVQSFESAFCPGAYFCAISFGAASPACYHQNMSVDVALRGWKSPWPGVTRFCRTVHTFSGVIAPPPVSPHLPVLSSSSSAGADAPSLLLVAYLTYFPQWVLLPLPFSLFFTVTCLPYLCCSVLLPVFSPMGILG